MRLVISGASGFVGQRVVPLLKQNGAEMLLVGRDTNALAALFPGEKTATYDEIASKGRGYDAMVHLAVLNNDQPGTDADFHAANVTLLETVIDACREAEVPRLIYTGTLHAVGVDTPYGRSKAAADALLKGVKDITLIELRLPAVYGEGAFKGKLGMLNKVPRFLRGAAFQVLASLKPTVYVQHVAKTIFDHHLADEPVKKILSDCQKTNHIYHITKRLIDIGFALIVILGLWWLLIGVWIAVCLTSKGPGILAQERVGRFGNIFTLYKFRTMQQGTKQVGTHEVSSASVTKIGHFLRSTKIDELPQVINILKGEISLVGPRPCLQVQEELIEERRNLGVLEVLPGITGYAQVRGVDMSDPVKLAKLDADYIKLRSTLLDLKTIIQTGSKGSLKDRTVG